MNTKQTILVVLILSSVTISQTAVTDTLYSVNSWDGGIAHLYENDSYMLLTGTGVAGDSPGDGYNPFLWVWFYAKGYYTFPLTELPNDSIGFELINATLLLFQYASHGNDERGVYPIWDFPGGDTNYCYLDHIDYGYQLDLGDWTAGDSGDTQTLYPLYTIVSSTPDTGFRYIDVTELVFDDLENDRQRSQFRFGPQGNAGGT